VKTSAETELLNGWFFSGVFCLLSPRMRGESKQKTPENPTYLISFAESILRL
jgi:hypothetical protein